LRNFNHKDKLISSVSNRNVLQSTILCSLSVQVQKRTLKSSPLSKIYEMCNIVNGGNE